MIRYSINPQAMSCVEESSTKYHRDRVERISVKAYMNITGLDDISFSLHLPNKSASVWMRKPTTVYNTILFVDRETFIAQTSRYFFTSKSAFNEYTESYLGHKRAFAHTDLVTVMEYVCSPPTFSVTIL